MPLKTPTHTSRFEKAVTRFDEANAEDPNVETVDGVAYPRELLYAHRMTRRLEQLAPDASEPLRLAARCQHIRRWTIPRSTYPMDRTGYKRWRSALMHFHAETAGAILREVGYEEETVTRVQDLVTKRRLKRDPEAQTLEDVVWLVFLEHYFTDFARQHDEAKLVAILRKTWLKMSTAGHEAALELDLPPETRRLIEKALQDA